MNIQPYQGRDLPGQPAEQQQQQYSIEQLRTAWLDAKFKKSRSQKTRTAYAETFDSFRATLQQFALDMDGDATQVSLIAQGWASQRSAASNRDGDIAASTINQRLAILSSFYRYGKRQRILKDNPIEMVERAEVQEYANAEAKLPDEVEALLKQIDRRTIEGKRDYALLSIGFTTGNRVSAIATLHFGNLTIKPTKQGERVTIHFTRLKGGEVGNNDLDAGTSAALIDYLHALYGAELGHLAHNAPLWVSLSRNDSRGKALSIQALEQICYRRVGTSKFHTLRHTFAVGMVKAGAPESEVQKKLRHKNLTTTGRYLDHFKSAHNEYGSKIEGMFGISAYNNEETNEDGE